MCTSISSVIDLYDPVIYPKPQQDVEFVLRSYEIILTFAGADYRDHGPLVDKWGINPLSTRQGGHSMLHFSWQPSTWVCLKMVFLPWNDHQNIGNMMITIGIWGSSPSPPSTTATTPRTFYKLFMFFLRDFWESLTISRDSTLHQVASSRRDPRDAWQSARSAGCDAGRSTSHPWRSASRPGTSWDKLTKQCEWESMCIHIYVNMDQLQDLERRGGQRNNHGRSVLNVQWMRCLHELTMFQPQIIFSEYGLRIQWTFGNTIVDYVSRPRESTKKMLVRGMISWGKMYMIASRPTNRRGGGLGQEK